MATYEIKRHIRTTCITYFTHHAESQFNASIVSIVEHWLDNCCEEIKCLRTLPKALQAKLPQGKTVDVNATIQRFPGTVSKDSPWAGIEQRDDKGKFQGFSYALSKSYPVVDGCVGTSELSWPGYGRGAGPLVLGIMVHDLQSQNIPVKNGLWGSDLEEVPSFLSSLSYIYAKGNTIDNLLAPYLKDFESLRQIQQSFPALVSLVHDPDYVPKSVGFYSRRRYLDSKAQFEEEYKRMQNVDKARQRRRKCKISSEPSEELINLVAEASIIKAAKVGI